MDIESHSLSMGQALIILWMLALFGKPVAATGCACGRHGHVLMTLFPDELQRLGMAYAVNVPIADYTQVNRDIAARLS